MANALNKDLDGSVILLDEDAMKDQYSAPEERVVKVLGGFGASAVTRGTALIVGFYSDGEKARFEGPQVSELVEEDAEDFDYESFCQEHCA
jgi:hypothetical protein